MKIINNNKLNKYFKIILIFLISFSIKNSQAFKLKFNSESLSLNYALQKALLSTDDTQIINVYNKYHKINTEGLFIDGNIIYESGLLNNQNILIKKEYPSNKLIKGIPLGNFPVKGIAKCSNKFYQLTGVNKKILSYTYPELNIINNIQADEDLGTGEGLARLSEDFLIASNGTSDLSVLDCKNDLSVIKTISVVDENDEYIGGIKDIVVVGEFIYANKNNDYRIFKINPETGKVLKKYNMKNLIDFEFKSKSINSKDLLNNGSMLNGITYDYNKKLFILTGKNWGHYYEVDLK